MKVFSSFLILIAVVSTAMAAQMPAIPVADQSWKKISNDDGVIAYSKEVPGSDIVAFRGETTIDASIAKVANVLIDTSRKKEWVHKLAEARDVRQISTYERIEYNHTSSGFFLVRDRDFVFRAKAELNKEKRQMVFTITSVKEDSVPETDKVRGELKDGRYILTALSPNKTHVVVEIAADPKGSVPKWLVNLFQKSWPTKSLNGIRAQCAKADVQEHAGIKGYFSEATAASAPAAAPAGAPGALQ